jgi:hypothetical protein
MRNVFQATSAAAYNAEKEKSDVYVSDISF